MAGFKNLKSRDGFGLLQVLMFMALLVLMGLGVAEVMQQMNNQTLDTKALTGRDSLTNGLLSLVTVEALCSQSQKLAGPIPFNPKSATIKGGPVQGVTYSQRQNLKFSLQNQSSANTPNIIGQAPYPASATPIYFGQFNAYIGSLYFSAHGTTSYTELATGNPALTNAKVYKGELWVNVAKSGGSPTAPPVALADRRITDSLYVWVKGNLVVGCGILKTPDQVCMDDLGGKYNYGTIPVTNPPTPPCTQIPSPCDQIGETGYYFTGFDANNKPVCIPSPASCVATGQTMESDGKGGWTCVTVH